MLCVPTARVEMDNVATPLAFSVELPICAVPSRKLTCPIGVPIQEKMLDADQVLRC